MAVFSILTCKHLPCGNREMCGSALEHTDVASIFSEDEMGIISFGGHSQVGQALGKYVWCWVPHPHMYTPSLWEQRFVIRMSGSALELNKGWHPSSVKIICSFGGYTLVRHWGITRGVGFPIPTCTHLPCGNRELSSKCLDPL